jgi:hypothetical protein
MKVTVVFQRDDIQALVLKELEAKGLKPAIGSDVKIKGMPKEVIVVVDVNELPEAAPAVAAPIPAPASTPGVTGLPAGKPSDAYAELAEVPMEKILEASKEIKKEKPVPPPKGMRVQVFTDFPDEDRVK